jgi:hypothetical protein
MWPKVLIKWRDAGALNEAIAKDAPLRVWRDMAKELYGIQLDLKSDYQRQPRFSLSRGLSLMTL